VHVYAFGRACTCAHAELGVEKPNRCIFEAALEALGDVAPEDALHVGDDRCCNLRVLCRTCVRLPVAPSFVMMCANTYAVAQQQLRL
jgi:hypothetical protein